MPELHPTLRRTSSAQQAKVCMILITIESKDIHTYSGFIP